mgnify:CR=1 FL=1
MLMAENTLEKIHDIATREFLEKGFRGASLREIVKKAGVTTGAFYGYYKSKEELFDALVSSHGEYVRQIFYGYVDEFLALPQSDWPAHMDDYSKKGMLEMYEYVSEHKDVFRLILKASEGTKWENYVHEIVEAEIDITHKFYEAIQKIGYKPYILNPMLEHMIISGEFTGLFELVIHDISKEDGRRCVEELHDFYEAAWGSVLRMNV